MVTTMTTWNPTTHADYDALKGWDAFSRDDEKIGTIEAIFHPQLDMPAARDRHVFLVKPGMLKSLFGGDEVYVPETAIFQVTPEKVVLSVPKDQLQSQAWTTKPTSIEAFRRS